MDEDLAQIAGLIRHHLHLTDGEIEGYLEDSLDRDQREMVEEHLRRCPYCSSELAFVRDTLAEEGPSSILEDILEAARRLIRFRPRQETFDPKTTYTTLCIGARYYPLLALTATEGSVYLETVGLVASKLLLARDRDRTDPGSQPVGIGIAGKRPIIASLSDFHVTQGFQDQREDSRARGKLAHHGPAKGEAVRSAAMDLSKVARMPDKKPPEVEKLKSDMYLKCDTKTHLIEFFLQSSSEKVFLRITKKKH
ncbi:anti-sigma factor family protein [Desulfomonile tiedjei]|uniref:Zinc-finger domain-containing protein n=1 Tax=Desulfomonile tiedjei (strain ATCC 49306 / DSM 6799 / DCB-1) TaxID=706587 RepID=I4C914_DESTA|nr:zf-HC2 domain-containing protein [Desulfomonile tiedjei]AFM26055.1 hypothetical protein Desti_3401 [Desulfomonile tiedjei DSM 6799]